MELVELGKTPHRERAIDVPESFVAVVKQSPRYPPPQPRTSLTRNESNKRTLTNQQVDLYSHNATHHSHHQQQQQSSSSSTSSYSHNTFTASSAHTFHSPQTAAAHLHGGTLNLHHNNNNNNNNISNGFNNNAAKMSLEADRLKRYSHEFQRKQKEDELLRCSLRDSKKLQQLVHQQQQQQQQQQSSSSSANNNNSLIRSNGIAFHEPHAIVNCAFESDELDFKSSIACPSQSMAPIEQDAQQRSTLIQHLPSTLDRLLTQCADTQLNQLIESTSFDQLLQIYCTVMQQQQQSILKPYEWLPTLPNASLAELVQQTIVALQPQANSSNESAELLNLLSKFELDGLCVAFDKIHHNQRCLAEMAIQNHQLTSNHHHQPSMMIGSDGYTSTGIHPSHMDVEELKGEQLMYDERIDGTIRVVRLEKENCEPLGVTIKNDPDGSVVIARIVKGGAAEKCGLMNEGDEILEINGMEMEGRNVNQISDMLAEINGTLTFILASRDNVKMVEPIRMTPSVVHLRALFDYDPEDDIYIPCRELGICFGKGDIIHVIDQTDLNWWQAYKQGEHEQSLAGLVPSIHFQMQRESVKQSLLNDSIVSSKGSSTGSRSLLCGARRSKKKQRQLSANSSETLTYEEVHLYYPRANVKRPVVLIGPTNIGRHELRQRIMLDTERFAAAVPHTSRSRRDGEMDGVDYHFITRSEFELHIKQGKFVEHGQYEGNYYGTSLGAIEAVVQSGKICVLNLHVHSIHILRQGPAGAKLKPFFVFVAPPTQLDRLNKLIASTSAAQHGQMDHCALSATDLQSILEEAREIENKYGHYFDLVLSMTDIDRAYNELMREINALEREPQWIPKVWLK